MSTTPQFDWAKFGAKPTRESSPAFDWSRFTHTGPGRVAPAPPVPPVASASARLVAGMERGAKSVLDAPRAIYEAATAPPTTPEEERLSRSGLALPFNRLLVDPQAQVEKRAREAAEKGQTTKSMFLSAAAGIPIGGPIAAGIYETAESGDTAGAIGEGLFMGALISLGEPKVRAGIKTGAARVGRGVKGALDTRRIQLASQELADVAKPTPRKFEAFKRDVETALPDIAEAVREQGIKLKGNERVAELRDIVQARADKIWNEGHKPMIERQAGAPMNVEAIKRRALAEIAQEDVRVSPGPARIARHWAEQAFKKPLNVRTADNMIRRLNAEIKTLPEIYGNIGKRVRQKAVEALRKELDATLERHGEAGVRDVNRRYGALRNIAATISNRVKAAELNPPPGLSDLTKHPFKTGAGAILGAGAGGLEGAAAGGAFGLSAGMLSDLYKIRRAPGAKAARAAKRLGKTSLRATPRPLPAHVPLRALLPERAGGFNLGAGELAPQASMRVTTGPPLISRQRLLSERTSFDLGAGELGLPRTRVSKARSRVVRDPKTGRFKRVYTSEPLSSLLRAH